MEKENDLVSSSCKSKIQRCTEEMSKHSNDIELENVVDGIVISRARMYPKDPKEYSADEKEDAALDINLQLILVESLDPVMYSHVVNCKDVKHIWETIENIN